MTSKRDQGFEFDRERERQRDRHFMNVKLGAVFISSDVSATYSVSD